jgi:hypothetical protein
MRQGTRAAVDARDEMCAAMYSASRQRPWIIPDDAV